ncbi:MAG: hypothetical protein FJY15_01445 [Bacteroidetes bacterium]|nr:hypothetical protein [Bacteroidota bacterium]
MPKKEYLNFDFDDIAFRAIAVHTALPPALLAWHTDRILGTKFSLLPDSFLLKVKKGISEHTQYYFREEESGTEWWLMENQGTFGLLMNVKPIPDMLLIGRGGEDEDAGLDWPEKLETLQGMTLVYAVSETEKKKLTWITCLEEKR